MGSEASIKFLRLMSDPMSRLAELSTLSSHSNEEEIEVVSKIRQERE